MRKFTEGERLDMIGEKFKYYSADGTLEIDSVVGGYSRKIGLSLVAVDGAVNLRDNTSLDRFKDENGTICVQMLMIQHTNFDGLVDDCFTKIKDTGVVDERGNGVNYANPVCQF